MLDAQGHMLCMSFTRALRGPYKGLTRALRWLHKGMGGHEKGFRAEGKILMAALCRAAHYYDEDTKLQPCGMESVSRV